MGNESTGGNNTTYSNYKLSTYTPTEWKTGDVVTAERLNKIEQQLSRGGI